MILDNNIISKSPIFYTNSGTSALLCALYSLNLSKDSIIIGPDYGYFSWFNVCRILGYTNIIIGEVNKNLNLSYEYIENCVNEYNIKCIFYIHHVGILDDDVIKIHELCKKKNIFLIEDSCIALGVSHPYIKPFTFGDASTYSFSDKKIISVDEGGALVIHNDDLMERAQEMQFQGNFHRYEYNPDKKYLNMGLNLQMSKIVLSILTMKLKELPILVKERELVFEKIRNKVDILYHDKQSSPARFIIHVKNMKKFNMLCKMFKIEIDYKNNYKSLSSLGFCKLDNSYEDNLVYLPHYQDCNDKLYTLLDKINV